MTDVIKSSPYVDTITGKQLLQKLDKNRINGLSGKFLMTNTDSVLIERGCTAEYINQINLAFLSLIRGNSNDRTHLNPTSDYSDDVDEPNDTAPEIPSTHRRVLGKS
jgi:hypothetical protein